jgi:hypothetical protein
MVFRTSLLKRCATFNFFRPRVAQRTTRSYASPLPTIVDESSPSLLEVLPPLPLLLIFVMSLLSKNLKWTKSSGILLVFLTIPQRHVGPCMLSLRRNALTKLSPTPRALMHRHTLEFGTITNSHQLRSKFFLCPDDIEHCVKGSRRKWVDKFSTDQERPPIPPVWPIKIGTNLTRLEILKLKNVGFQLPQKERIMPTCLFNTSAPPLDLSGIDVPTTSDSYPSSRQSKSTRRSATAPSTKQMKMVASARAMGGTILKVTMIPRPGFGCVLTLQSKHAPI